MVQLRRTAANAIAYDMECALLTPDRRWSGGRRCASTTCSGDLAARRRQGQPDRPDQVAGQGRPAAAAPRSWSSPGDGVDARGTGGRRGSPCCTDRAGHEQSVEAEVVVNCAGPVGQGARRPGGRDRAAALRRALLRGDRRDRGHPPGPADHAGPGRLDVLQGGGRRAGRRWLRAGGQAVAVAGRRSRTRSSSSCSRRTGSTSRCSWTRRSTGSPRWARPGSASSTTGRSRSRPTTSSCWARRRGWTATSSAPGFNSVGIASAGGAGRALAEWIVEGEPTSDLVAVDIRRFAPFHGNNQRGCGTGWPRCSACTTPSRGPTARSGRRARSAARPCTTGWRRRRVVRVQDGLGAPQLLRPGR